MEPSSLKFQDKIAILSTARKIQPELLDTTCTLIEQQGFVPVLGDTIEKSHNQFAGTDDERLADLQQAFNNPEIKAIWCARGGYGTARLLERLDFTQFLKSPKWIIGYSDVTALLCQLSRLGISTIHGTMPINIQNLNRDEQANAISVFNCITGKSNAYQLNDHPLNRPGDATGKLVGGNLSILYSLLGSADQLNTQGCILFIEDLDEYLYHVDRMFLALKRAEMLNGLKALIVGGMSDMNDNAIPFGMSANEIIAHHTAEFSYPIYFDGPFGHQKTNRALKVNSEYQLRGNILSPV